MINIENTIDRLSVFKECILGLHECTDKQLCSMNERYTGTSALKSFEETIVSSLVEDLKSGLVYITHV